MKTPHRIALIAALLTAAGGVAAASPAAADSALVIHGTISLGDASHPAAAGEARVSLVGTYLDTSVQPVGSPVLTDASGGYSLTTTTPYTGENLELRVEYLGAGGYQSVYGNRAHYVGLPGEGEDLSRLPGPDIAFDQTLPLPTTITGRILTTANAAPPVGSVTASRSDAHQWFSAHPDQAPPVKTLADGTYTITGLLPGVYSLVFDVSASSSSGYRVTDTRPFTVDTSGGSVAAPDQVAYGQAYIGAGFQCPRCSNASGSIIGDSQLLQVEPDGSETVVQRRADYIGSYGTYGFQTFPGTYRVMEYIGGQPEAGAFWSDPITVGEYDSVTPTTTLTLPATTRLAGADRYGTSAMISANTCLRPRATIPASARSSSRAARTSPTPSPQSRWPARSARRSSSSRKGSCRPRSAMSSRDSILVAS
ncbi:Putative cell wall-binding protein OS=Leifsonia shinshuensis OX=150026 GN=HNR13_001860 PE=4 SV=1 [Leifsonia shinshuensis]